VSLCRLKDSVVFFFFWGKILLIFNETKIGDIFGVFLSTLNRTDFAKIWKTLPNFQYQNLLKRTNLASCSQPPHRFLL